MCSYLTPSLLAISTERPKTTEEKEYPSFPSLPLPPPSPKLVNTPQPPIQYCYPTIRCPPAVYNFRTQIHVVNTYTGTVCAPTPVRASNHIFSLISFQSEFDSTNLISISSDYKDPKSGACIMFQRWNITDRDYESSLLKLTDQTIIANNYLQMKYAKKTYLISKHVHEGDINILNLKQLISNGSISKIDVQSFETLYLCSSVFAICENFD
jgi:hypothetical protein